MADPVDKMQRIAMATVSEGRLLDSVVGELAAHGVQPSQMCIVGHAPAVRHLRDDTASHGLKHASGLFDCLHEVGRIDGGDLVASAARPHIGIDFETERKAQGLLSGLDSLMLDGVVALLVTSRTIGEFAAVTRLLLRYSSHRVRTREVAQAHD